jgi:hypothetical protein
MLSLTILKGVLLEIFNFTNLTDDFMDYWQYPYKLYLGEAFWVVIFGGVIGFSYVVSKRDIAVTTAATLLTFGVFGTTQTFMGQPGFNLFFSIVAIAGYAGTVMLLFVKRSWF